MKIYGKKVQKILGEDIKPRLLVGGKTGVGKSSVLNALLGKNVYEVGVTPTTKENGEKIWNSKTGDIVVVDVPGFGEAEASKVDNSEGECTYEDNIKSLALLDAHLLLIVLKADDRALQLEQDFLENWEKDSNSLELPVIVAVNQIDKINPVRDWEPQNLNLKTPKTKKEKNIRKYIDYVSSLNCFSHLSFEDKIIPVSAGEEAKDPYQYGIEDLRNKIYEVLPESAKTVFARAAELKNKEAKRLIKYFSASCAGAVAANFLPASDALVLAPIQIAMIIKLGKLHGLDITYSTASGILSSIGLSLAGRYTAQTVLSFFPGIKNLVGPSLAYGLTYTMGLIVNDFFKEEKTKITKEDLNNIREEYEKAGKEAAASYSDS